MDKSEYRKKQEAVESKRQEGRRDAYRQKIISALERIAEQTQAAENQAQRADTFHRRVETLTLRLEGRKFWLELAETIGLWVAASVGIAAIIISSNDSDKQRKVTEDQLTAMTGQLAEIKSNREQTADLIDANKKLAEAAQTANRAWISPRLISIDGSVTDKQPVNIRVSYDNAGRTPALDVEIRTEVKILGMTGGLPVTPEIYGNLKVGEANPCKSEIVNYAGVVYPASDRSSTYASWVKTVDPTIAERIRARTIVLVINGCYLYSTLNDRHKSVLCVYLEPVADKSPEQWEFRNCADGNYAD